MTLETFFYGVILYLAFIWVMSRFLIVAIGDNDDLSDGQAHE